MKKTVVYIDPPSGWLYGFPKPAPKNIQKMSKEQLHEWFVANGYPQREIDYWNNTKNGMLFRSFLREEQDEALDRLAQLDQETGIQ